MSVIVLVLVMLLSKQTDQNNRFLKDSIPHPPFIKNLTLFRKVWFPLFFFFFNYYSAMFCIDILERSNILSEAHILWSACQMNNLNLFSSSSAGSVFLLFFYYYFFHLNKSSATSCIGTPLWILNWQGCRTTERVSGSVPLSWENWVW